MLVFFTDSNVGADRAAHVLFPQKIWVQKRQGWARVQSLLNKAIHPGLEWVKERNPVGRRADVDPMSCKGVVAEVLLLAGVEAQGAKRGTRCPNWKAKMASGSLGFVGAQTAIALWNVF